MIKIGSVDKFVNLYVQSPAQKAICKPNKIPILKSELKNLTPVWDLLKPIFDKNKSISVEEVQNLFQNGHLKGGYLRRGMYKIKGKLLWEGLAFNKNKYKLWKHSVDLSSKLTPNDYKEISEFMNLHNGKFLKIWKQQTKPNDIPNHQKLALFIRSIRRTDKLDFYKNLSEKEWETCIEGIVNRPRNVVSSLLDYKLDSTVINSTASKGYGKKSIMDKIKNIEKFLNTQETKCPMKVYRGEGNFGIFSQIKVEKENTTLEKIMNVYTSEIEKGLHSQEEIKKFIDTFLLSKNVTQNRFLSTGIGREAGERYAQKVFWEINIPIKTKASMIEAYNVEREAELELLIQRNSKLTINKAIYNIFNKRWELCAELSQGY